MHRLFPWTLGLCVFGLLACHSAQAAAPYPWPTYSIVPIFFVPKDWDVNSVEVQAEAAALRIAVSEIQQFYARRLGGNTFALNELVVLQATQAKEAYGIHWNGGNIYADGINLDDSMEALVVAELHDRGYPTPPAQNESGYSALIFVKGAGGFAGGRAFGGADGGWAILGDWAIDSIQGQVPEGAYWWSGRRLQIGAAAHELGHTFGLPHPDAWGGDFAGKIMGNWWDYPNVGFADWENDQLNRSKVQFFTQCRAPTALAPAPAVKPYELLLLPTLGADTRALHINEHGLISGFSESIATQPHLVLFGADGSSITDLGTNAGRNAAATSVNEQGVVSGFWESASGTRRATRSHYDASLNQWVTEELPALHPEDAAVAYDINDSGLIVGGTRMNGGQASIWKGAGVFGGNFGLESLAIGVNNRAQIVGRVLTDHGQRGFVWQDNGNGIAQTGEWVDLGVTTTIAGAYSEAFDVNERGQVVGSVYDGGLGRRYAFRITPQGGRYFIDAGNGTNALMTVLGRLGRGLDYAVSINDRGVAVGRSGTCAGLFQTHATLWKDDQVLDLNDYVLPQTGVTLISAEGINKAGEIVGSATTTAGIRGFLLRPIVPSAPAVIAARVVGHRIALSWEDLSRNESGFELERRIAGVSTDPDTGWVRLITASPNTEAYEDAKTVPNVGYEYRIRAFNDNGASEYALWPVVRTKPNRSPVAASDSYALVEDNVLAVDASKGVLANDSDPDGDPLTVQAVVVAPKRGQLQWSGDGAFRYTPKPGYHGSDRFEYLVRDGYGGEARGVVSLKIDKPPQPPKPPKASDDSYRTVQNTPLCIGAPGVLGNDRASEGDPMRALLHEAPRAGKVDLASDGRFCYRPRDGFVGDDRFTYWAVSASGKKDEAKVTVRVGK